MFPVALKEVSNGGEGAGCPITLKSNIKFDFLFQTMVAPSPYLEKENPHYQLLKNISV